PTSGLVNQGATRRGNQISGCDKGIHTHCTAAGTCPGCTITATVRYNAIQNNNYGVYAEKTSAPDLGPSGGAGYNIIQGSVLKCVKKTNGCGTLNAVGNLWPTACAQPTCKDPNTN